MDGDDSREFLALQFQAAWLLISGIIIIVVVVNKTICFLFFSLLNNRQPFVHVI